MVKNRPSLLREKASRSKRADGPAAGRRSSSAGQLQVDVLERGPAHVDVGKLMSLRERPRRQRSERGNRTGRLDAVVPATVEGSVAQTCRQRVGDDARGQGEGDPARCAVTAAEPGRRALADDLA